LLDALIQLQKKIRTETILDRKKYLEAHKPRVKLSDDSELALPLDELEIYHWGVQTEGYELNKDVLTRKNVEDNCVRLFGK